MVASKFNFRPSLAYNATSAAEGAHCISSSASFDAVAFASFSTEQESWDERQEAERQAAQNTAFVQVIGVAIHQAWSAKRPTAA